MKFELLLAQPIEEHARSIFDWRNDPVTLRNSYHSEPKEWDKFLQEYLSGYFNFPDLPPLFALKDGQKVAFLKFDPVEDFAGKSEGVRRRCCSISINIGPEYRGKGLGSSLLQAIKPWIKQQGYDAVYGEVKVQNEISRKAFLNAGYRYIGEFCKCIDEREIPIVRFVADLASNGESRVFIVAEAGSNWRMGNYKRDLAMAKTLIHLAAESGADAVKFQVFKPETIYVSNAGRSQYLENKEISDPMEALFSDLMLPYEMLEELHAECLAAKIEFMATPFSKADFEAVDPFVKRHKIASYELNHPHLLAMAAESGKPLFLSTGASTEEEIAWAVETFRLHGGNNLTLLQCTAAYPASPSSMHLQALPWLKKRFQAPVGLSDHSQNAICAAISAVALGASVLEKHFTLNKRLPGPDHPFALEPDELKLMVKSIREAEQMQGCYVKVVDPIEEELRQFSRRGIQAIKKIQIGDVLHEGVNLAILRPGSQPLGIHPKYLADLEGRTAKRQIGLGEGLQLGDY